MFRWTWKTFNEPFTPFLFLRVSGVDTRIWQVWRWQVERTTWVWRAPSSGPSSSASWWWPPTSTAPCWWAPALRRPRRCRRPGLCTPSGKHSTRNTWDTQRQLIGSSAVTVLSLVTFRTFNESTPSILKVTREWEREGVSLWNAPNWLIPQGEVLPHPEALP